jgi:cobalt-zinc-cadmium efflux system protein
MNCLIQNSADRLTDYHPKNFWDTPLEQQFLQIEGVQSSHHTHLWSLDGEHHVLTTHLIIDEKASKDDVLRVKLASKKIVNNLNIEHLTIEIEYKNEDCDMKEEN